MLSLHADTESVSSHKSILSIVEYNTTEGRLSVVAAALDSKLSRSVGDFASLASESKHNTIVEEREEGKTYPSKSPTKAPAESKLKLADSKAITLKPNITSESNTKVLTASKSNLLTDSRAKISSDEKLSAEDGKSPAKTPGSGVTDKEPTSVFDVQGVSVKEDDIAVSEAVSTEELELLPPVIVIGEVCHAMLLCTVNYSHQNFG